MIDPDMKPASLPKSALPFVLSCVISFPAAASNEISALCFSAAQSAAEATGVPLAVLWAVALTETGREIDGQLQAWPWALNEGGSGFWFKNAESALDHLSTATRLGTTNIDVGCFQLNYRWHASAFDSLEQMMNPAANALYAAGYLQKLYAETGNWIDATAAYHSKTPEYAERYAARFTPIYEALLADGAFVAPAPDLGSSPNGYPLMMAGVTMSAGSIVPLRAAPRRFLGEP